MRRLLGAAFLADFQLYLIYTAMPFKALQLGAGPLELGGLAAASTGAYAVLVGLCGRLSDRVPRTSLARLSCLGFLVGCIGLTGAPDLAWMFLFAPFVGGSMAPFWPSVQASLADRSPASRLERTLGRFNLCWSTGKGTGFLVGGAFVSALGVAATFTFAAAVAFSLFFLLPPEASPTALGSTREAAGEHAIPGEGEPQPESKAGLFRRLAWIANGVAFGLAATLNHHYPRLVREFGWSPRTFGMFLGLVYLTQTLTFVALMLRPELWRYRRAALYVPQFLMLVAAVSLPFAGLERVFVSALVFGATLGTCYFSSIYYSLHTRDGRGRNAGVHEGLIGLGSMAIPLLGGAVARHLQVLWAPYVVAAAAVGLAILAEETLYRAGASRPAFRS